VRNNWITERRTERFLFWN